MNAVKFVKGTTEIVFTEFEAVEIEETPVRDVTVTQLSTGGYDYHAYPESKKRYTVTLKRRDRNAAKKIDNLLNMVGVIRFYPCLQYDDTYYVDVIRLIGERRTIIGWGYDVPSAEIIILQEV